METVQLHPKHSLPVTIRLRPNERLDKLAQEIAQHDNAIREDESQIGSLEVEAQKLDQSQTYSVESGEKRATIKRQLQAAEQQLLTHQTYKKRAQDERQQWLEETGLREYRRRLLWQELPEARPGPVGDWSMTKMYNFGEKEQRTTGDVKRDLVDTLSWLLRFSGPDDELQRELEQLKLEEQS